MERYWILKLCGEYPTLSGGLQALFAALFAVENRGRESRFRKRGESKRSGNSSPRET